MCYPGESNQWYKIYEEINGSDKFVMDDVSYNLSDNKEFIILFPSMSGAALI